MRLVVLLIICSLFILGCDNQKPDAFICTFVSKEQVNESYAFCVNARTKEEKEVPVEQLGKYIMAHPDDYEKIRDWYKSQCGR